MANVNGLGAVGVLALGMFFAVSQPIAAQDLTVAPAIRAALDTDAARPALVPPTAVRRPTVLVPLYVSFAALQVLDIRSTQQALNRGGVEGNPLMGGVVGSPVAMTAMKVGAAAGIVFLSEKVRKHHPVTAVAMMVAMNSAYAMVVSHNYAIARQ